MGLALERIRPTPLLIAKVAASYIRYLSLALIIKNFRPRTFILKKNLTTLRTTKKMQFGGISPTGFA